VGLASGSTRVDRYRFGQFATQNSKAVRQSCAASVQTKLQTSKFVCAVARHDASPPAQMLPPAAISLQAFTSAFRAERHELWHFFFVVGTFPKHVDLLLTHFFAQLTPAGDAKQLA